MTSHTSHASRKEGIVAEPLVWTLTGPAAAREQGSAVAVELQNFVPWRARMKYGPLFLMLWDGWV